MFKRLLLLWCLFSSIVNAAEGTDSDSGAWTGEGELGFTSISGNSDSESLNAKLGITREIDRWKHSASVRAIRAESEGVTSADSLLLSAKSEFELGDKSYVFGKLRHEDDEFSGYDYQTSLALGVGSRFVNSERHLLDASVGLGYRSIKDRVTGDTENEGIITADLIYEYRMSAAATFQQTILLESGNENTHVESSTSLTTRIDENLAARIGYLVKRNSDVPSGTDKTDKITTVSLVYGF